MASRMQIANDLRAEAAAIQAGLSVDRTRLRASLVRAAAALEEADRELRAQADYIGAAPGAGSGWGR